MEISNRNAGTDQGRLYRTGTYAGKKNRGKEGGVPNGNFWMLDVSDSGFRLCCLITQKPIISVCYCIKWLRERYYQHVHSMNVRQISEPSSYGLRLLRPAKTIVYKTQRHSLGQAEYTLGLR